MLAFALGLSLAAAPAEFIDDVRPLFQLITCQGVPAPLDEKTAHTWCEAQTKKYERFRDTWGSKARPFIESLKPAGARPKELVYPFGGGDLMTAVQVFPESDVITTISLELAGDPRRWKTLKDPKALKNSLGVLANASASTLMSNDSLSKNLSIIQRGEFPGQLSMHLMGLAMADLEPVSVRYFKLETDGSLHYYSQEEIDALEGQLAKSFKTTWRAPDFSPAFANVEVQFVPKGKPDAPRRVHRHIGANLGDEGIPPELLKHLEAKGRVQSMTKAASYLMWRETFHLIRDYLVTHSTFMVSDSTGVPPRHWLKQGCTVAAYGKFEKSFLGTWEGYQEELRKTFTDAKPVPIRFGYPDGSDKKHSHVLAMTCP